MERSILLAAALALFAAGTAGAQRDAGPCLPDIQKLCSDVEPGGGKIIACLMQHQDELSDECKTKALEAAQGGGKSAAPKQDACKEDAAQFCPDATGSRAKAACLKLHKDEISSGCKAALAKRAKPKRKKDPCLADIRNLCQDVKGGRAAKLRCLKENLDEVSAGCKAELNKKRKPAPAGNPCSSDIQNFCQGIGQGGGAIKSCLQEHEQELSQECRDGLQKLLNGGGKGGKSRGGGGGGFGADDGE